MSLKQLEKSVSHIDTMNSLLTIFVALIAVGLRIGAVFIWNYVMTDELNKFMFGSPDLPILKGFLLFVTIEMLVKQTPNQTTGGK